MFPSGQFFAVLRDRATGKFYVVAGFHLAAQLLVGKISIGFDDVIKQLTVDLFGAGDKRGERGLQSPRQLHGFIGHQAVQHAGINADFAGQFALRQRLAF